jgi:hypothetical protein
MACVLEAISLVWVELDGGLLLQLGYARGYTNPGWSLDDPDVD